MSAANKYTEDLGPLGFGCGPLGNMYEAVSDATSRETLDSAWESGIRYFDTSPFYGHGRSEHRVGASLRNRGRDNFLLSTKVGRVFHPHPDPEGGIWVDPLPFSFEFDYSAAGAERSLADSLQRLGMARIDYVFIHDLDPDVHGDAYDERFATAMNGAAVYLTDLRDAGIIRGWGLGVNMVGPCLQALDAADPNILLLATQYTLLDHTALEKLFPVCQDRGVSIVIGAPYQSGLLAGGRTYNYADASQQQLASRNRLQGIADDHAVDLRAAALQFPLAHPVVVSVIPGTKRPHNVRMNAELIRTQVPSEFWAELKAVEVLPQSAPTPS